MSNWLEDIRAAWLGKIIGVRLGAPVENWSSQQIKDSFGKIEDFVKDYTVFGADDDTNGPLYFTRVLLDKKAKEITSQDIADNMLNVIADEHGFFWWGGVGVSTEHTMYNNLKNGMSALESGSSRINGKELSEQIGGQIFSDGWAYAAYDNVELAVDLASKAASVSHDGEAVEGAKFVSAAISLAFTHKDIFEVMQLALEYCDPHSEYVRVAKEVIAYSCQSKDWEDTLDYIQRTYPYSCYGGICPIIPNMAVMVMAMACGKQDFRETLLICVNAGYDTDCNVGNVGSIMGALVGIDGLFSPWVYKINDVVLSSGLLGSINSLDATQQTLYFGQLANLINPKLTDNRIDSNNDFSFCLPYSTHGFFGRWHKYFDGSHINVAMDDAKYKRALQINVHSALPQESLEFIKKTYFRASEVHDSRYEPSLAPVLWPGQKVNTRLKAECDGLFMAHLLVRDIDGKMAKSKGLVLTSEFVDFEILIPSDFSLVAEVGVELICLNRTFLTHIWMDSVMINGSAEFDWDVTRLPIEDYGLTFYMGNHREIAGCTHVNGDWVVDGGITCLSDERAMLLFGDVRWQQPQFEVSLQRWEQGSAVCFAVLGARRYIEIVRINQTLFHINKVENGKIHHLSEVIISHVKSAQISLHIVCVSHIIIFKVDGLTVGKLFINEDDYSGGLGFISTHKNSIFITGIRVSKADFKINEEET
jgi:ADP-ribosylglycohydrolase